MSTLDGKEPTREYEVRVSAASTSRTEVSSRPRLDRWTAQAALAGLLGALAFPLVIPGLGSTPILDGTPRELLMLPAAALLYRVARAPLLRRWRVWLGFVAGLAFFAVLIYWLDIAMSRYGQMPQWQAVPALALLVAYCALYWAAVPLLTELVAGPARLPAPLAFGLAVVALEWLRGVLLTGFPWGLWGYSQARNLPLIHLASVAGVYGVSFVIACAGALLGEVLSPRRSRRAAALQLGAFLAAAHGAGAVMLAGLDADEGPGVRVAIAQGNVEQQIKNRADMHRDSILGSYQELTHEAVQQGAEVVVWPEAAWPGHLSADLRQLPRLKPGRPLLLGAGTYRSGRDRAAFNSAFWADAGGAIGGRYDKQHLVPFGEYVPLRAILPVEKLVPGMIDYSAGTSPDPIGEPPFGVLICYDGIFPEIGTAAARAGAEVLANLTNDGWYGISSAPYQHRDFYVLRAVETDRWVVRAANTGISTFVSPAGRLLGSTRLETATVTMQTVWPRRGRTAYVWIGDWLPALALGACLGGLAELVWRRRHRHDFANHGSGVDSGTGSHAHREAGIPVHHVPRTLH